ncbi:MAG: NlpC/P60 family protein [Lachnospiraceae bacterium]|nr:NlpC/P60 family protein [Lachnospiraceae bacterium]MDY5742772.1 NlpC/P60 family protein [Lachnospiraceae bacterium]
MKNRTVKLAALCLTAMVVTGSADISAKAETGKTAVPAYKSVAGATVVLDSISKDRAAEQKINEFLNRLGEKSAVVGGETAQAVKARSVTDTAKEGAAEKTESKKAEATASKKAEATEEKKAEENQKVEKKTTNVYVTAGSSNVLAYPQADSPVVAVLPAGDSYVLAGEEADYYLVQFGQVIGYVPKADAEIRETVASEVSAEFVAAVEKAQVESDQILAERQAAAEKAAAEKAAAEKAAAEKAAAEKAAAEKAAAEQAAAQLAAARQQNTQAEVASNQVQPSTTQEAPVVPASQATKPSAPASSKGAAVAAAAMAQLGAAQDCTMLVTNSLKAVGINFHGWPADYFSLGTVVSASEAQPGDLIYYDNAGAGVPHIAVYTGGGRSVHGGWLGANTVEYSAYLGTGPVFIRLR